MTSTIPVGAVRMASLGMKVTTLLDELEGYPCLIAHCVSGQGKFHCNLNDIVGLGANPVFDHVVSSLKKTLGEFCNATPEDRELKQQIAILNKKAYDASVSVNVDNTYVLAIPIYVDAMDDEVLTVLYYRWVNPTPESET